MTSSGPYGTGRYFLRLAVTGHPDSAETYDLGNGSLWPVLDGERAEHDLQTGSFGSAASLLRTMGNMTSGLGMVPGQAWEDPAVAAPLSSPAGTCGRGRRACCRSR